MFVVGGVFVDSAHCLQEGDYDRPSAAYLNFCPLALSTDSAHTAIQLQLVIKELIHSLVSREALALYIWYKVSFVCSNLGIFG